MSEEKIVTRSDERRRSGPEAHPLRRAAVARNTRVRSVRYGCFKRAAYVELAFRAGKNDNSNVSSESKNVLRRDRNRRFFFFFHLPIFHRVPYSARPEHTRTNRADPRLNRVCVAALACTRCAFWRGTEPLVIINAFLGPRSSYDLAGRHPAVPRTSRESAYKSVRRRYRSGLGPSERVVSASAYTRSSAMCVRDVFRVEATGSDGNRPQFSMLQNISLTDSTCCTHEWKTIEKHNFSYC